jgi:hypothetical protein
VQSGCLVTRRNRWDINASQIGITIEATDETKEKWLVMWSLKGGRYALQIHHASALLEVNDVTDEHFKARTCTSA